MSTKLFLFTGPRAWEAKEPVELVIRKLVAEFGTGRIIIMAGGHSGLDHIAREVCEEQHVHFLEMKAQWSYLNRAAGPVRNGKMLDVGPDTVVAFYWDWRDHPGTLDCVQQAEQRGIRTVCLRYPKEKAMPSGNWVRDKQAAKAKKRRAK